MAKHLTNTFYLFSEPIAAVIIKVIGLLLLVCDLLYGWCCRFLDLTSYSIQHGKRDKERKNQEAENRDVVQEVAVRFMAESNGRYVDLKRLPDIGSRLQKYWFRAYRCGVDGAEVIISVTRESAFAVKIKVVCLLLLVRDLPYGLCLIMAKHLTNTFYLFSEPFAAVIIKPIGLLLLVCALLYGWCCRFLDLASSWIQHGKRDEERKNQEAENRDVVQEVAVRFVAESNGRYVDLKRLPDIGSRLQKYWFRAYRCGVDGAEVIISVTRVSTKCPVDLVKDMNTLNNKLFPEMKGPYIQPILEVRHYSAEQQLVVVQPFHSQGSLKDLIYDKSPITDWARKYFTFSSSPPPPHIMAKYGKQILEAILFLYDHGFHQVGHVQTGNIFLEGDYCRLGGFENTVFGYKTRLTSLLTGHMESMDLVMFGHVIFEMACGYELTTLVPTSEDLERVDDSSLLDVIHLIFHMDHQGRFTSSIDKVLRHRFFQPTMSDTGAWRKPRLPHVTFIKKEVKSILIKVKKGKALRTASDRKCRLQ